MAPLLPFEPQTAAKDPSKRSQDAHLQQLSQNRYSRVSIPPLSIPQKLGNGADQKTRVRWPFSAPLTKWMKNSKLYTEDERIQEGLFENRIRVSPSSSQLNSPESPVRRLKRKRSGSMPKATVEKIGPGSNGKLELGTEKVNSKSREETRDGERKVRRVQSLDTLERPPLSPPPGVLKPRSWEGTETLLPEQQREPLRHEERSVPERQDGEEELKLPSVSRQLSTSSWSITELEPEKKSVSREGSMLWRREDGSGEGDHTGIIVGGVLGGIAIVAILVFFLAWMFLRPRRVVPPSPTQAVPASVLAEGQDTDFQRPVRLSALVRGGFVYPGKTKSRERQWVAAGEDGGGRAQRMSLDTPTTIISRTKNIWSWLRRTEADRDELILEGGEISYEGGPKAADPLMKGEERDDDEDDDDDSSKEDKDSLKYGRDEYPVTILSRDHDPTRSDAQLVMLQSPNEEGITGPVFFERNPAPDSRAIPRPSRPAAGLKGPGYIQNPSTSTLVSGSRHPQDKNARTKTNCDPGLMRETESLRPFHESSLALTDDLTATTSRDLSQQTTAVSSHIPMTSIPTGAGGPKPTPTVALQGLESQSQPPGRRRPLPVPNKNNVNDNNKPSLTPLQQPVPRRINPVPILASPLTDTLSSISTRLSRYLGGGTMSSRATSEQTRSRPSADSKTRTLRLPKSSKTGYIPEIQGADD